MKTILVTILIAALLATAGLIAFIHTGIHDVSASAPHGSFTRWVMGTTMRSSVERRAARIEVPDLTDRSLLLAGVNDFEAMCAQCHGAPGEDPDAIGLGLNPPAPDLAGSTMTAAELFWVTKHGIRMTGMPSWGITHDDEALWPVVAFLTVLPELDAREYRDLLSQAGDAGHHAHDAADHPHGPEDDHGRSDDGDEHLEEPEGEPGHSHDHDH